MTSPLKKWGTLLVLTLALAIIVIDTTLLNVSLSAIIRDLHTDIQHLQWVITAYSLMLAALTITGGRLGDLFGRKRMFVTGAIIFAIGSFVASISTSFGVLILGESIIEGIGAVLMLPATTSLLISTFYGRDRAIAFGIWGGVAAAAAAVGPILGGYLTTNYSWRWGFRINVIVVVALVLGSFIIKESQDTRAAHKIDWGGVVLSGLGLLSLAFGIIESSTYGWLSSLTLGADVFGLIFIICFVLWELLRERRGRPVLVSPKLFKNRRFTSGIITTGIMFLGMSGLIFSIPVFLQSVRGLDAFHTGLGLLPMSLTLLVTSPLASYLSKWLYPKYLVMIGLAINMVAYLTLAFSINVDATVWTFTPGLILFGCGMGFVISQITNITLSAVPVAEAGEASGVNNTIRQIGSTLGSAIIGSILLTTIATGLTKGTTESTLIPESQKASVIQTVSAQASNLEFGGAQLGLSVPKEVQAELVTITHEATATGDRRAFLYSFAFCFLGLLAAGRLPRELNVEQVA